MRAAGIVGVLLVLGVAAAAGCAGSTDTSGSSNSISCTDGKTNGAETDVDCGGPCAPCAVGEGCFQDSDCVSGACEAQACIASRCGDGILQTGEGCDDGNQVDGDYCTNACALPSCGDGIVQPGEGCDDGNTSDLDGCLTTCVAASCGDGVVQDTVEQCDDAGMSALCNANCTLSMCGDMLVNPAAGEQCDAGAETAECDADCSAAYCGDGTVNAAAAEACDDGAVTAMCDYDCTAPVCGDGIVNGAAGEQCDDGGTIGGDGCSANCIIETGAPTGCSLGATLVSVAPGNNMALCDDPTNVTCEEDFEAMCPPNWHLCSMDEYNMRNTGWNQAISSASRALGVIYCRASGAAGHFTVPDAGSTVSSLSQDEVFNCYFGSSRPECPSGFGCNEQQSQALCCSVQSLCGNGVVDHAEEQCDDGNTNQADACLNNCTWRVPTDHGFSGTNCN